MVGSITVGRTELILAARDLALLRQVLVTMAGFIGRRELPGAVVSSMAAFGQADTTNITMVIGAKVTGQTGAGLLLQACWRRRRLITMMSASATITDSKCPLMMMPSPIACGALDPTIFLRALISAAIKIAMRAHERQIREIVNV